MNTADNRKKKLSFLTIIKISLFIGFALYLSAGLLSLQEKAAAVAEIGILLLITAAIKSKHVFAGWLLEGMLLFVIGLQFLFLKFARTYLTFIMLTNVDSLQALSGKLWVYAFWGTGLLLLSFLPHDSNLKAGRAWALLVVAAIACEAFLLVKEPIITPVSDYIDVVRDIRQNAQFAKAIEAGGDSGKEFLQEGIPSGIERPVGLDEQPNVVLIFTEGLSQHIVEDARSIMPNVANWEEKSLFFKNYYDHTFATYRGLIGQLYSGYQLNNLDENNLISLQQIFRNRGYYTSFINVEPMNRDFTEYLNRMGFHEVKDVSADDYIGATGSISDKKAYEALKQEIEERSRYKRPFFTVIYTFGTHVSLDSTYEQFGQGEDPVLNRFYDLDRQFGSFMEFFCESEDTDNTLLVFTADHASYADEDYEKAFPDVIRSRIEIDSIPLLFYYKGIQAESIDAKGRNSLDLAPTLLDYLDVSAQNSFLGSSLFTAASGWDTTFFYPSVLYSTEEGNVQPLSAENSEVFLKKVSEYFQAAKWKAAEEKISDQTELMEFGSSDAVSIDLSPDNRWMSVKYRPSADYTNVSFAVWSAIGEQDDLQWYEAAWSEEEACWKYTIDLSAHRSYGTYFVMVYSMVDDENQELDSTSAYVTEAVFPEEYVQVERMGEEQIRVSLITDSPPSEVLFPIWSAEDGQDDLVWYEGELDENGVWNVTVDLNKHAKRGMLCVHSYKKEDQDLVFIDGINVKLST